MTQFISKGMCFSHLALFTIESLFIFALTNNPFILLILLTTSSYEQTLSKDPRISIQLVSTSQLTISSFF